jgi:malate dehydrogenase (oxaloacetate-decarboxylating)(NADP+)
VLPSDPAPISTLGPDEQALLHQLGHPHAATAGSVLLEEGTPGRSFFLIVEGEVEVSREGERLGRLGPGALVGEMALFNHEVRFATVTVGSDARFVCVPAAEMFAAVLHGDPAAVRLMARLGTTMVERMQHSNKRLLEIARKTPGSEADLARLRQAMLKDWSLRYHSIGKAGKLEVVPTKAVGTAADLSVAYSPGVAEPCLAIAESPDLAYEYTGKGHLVGVISNGTAVLGLGNIGALAGKPVMEGKAVLFKRFAGLDAFDIEVAETDPQRFIDVVCALEPTFGGVNLEDIKAPECFEIERICQERMQIPVFHDDQHGTAIVAGAGLLNAVGLVGKRIESLRVVVSGKGAAGFTCARTFVALGVPKEQVLICDRKGVVYEGRGDTGYVTELAARTDRRTLAEAVAGADVFLGLSQGGLLTPAMLETMAPDPLVFALANPVPEIDYDLAVQTRPDAIVGTGRSDYPNQINNVIAFPYIFRGALDVRARAIDAGMKRAASEAIARVARLGFDPGDGTPIPFGRALIVPKPFDPRLKVEVSVAVAAAAIESGLARRPLDLEAYRAQLERS